MTIYSLSTTSTAYLVVIEYVLAVARPTVHDMRLFAMGAASLRDGGPVGAATLDSFNDDAGPDGLGRAYLRVEALTEEGPKFA